MSVLNEAATFALGAKPQVLIVDQFRSAETVMDLGQVDIRRPHARHFIGCTDPTDITIEKGIALVIGISSGDMHRGGNPYGFCGQLPGLFKANQHHGRGPISPGAALVKGEGVTNHPGIEHLVYTDRLAKLRIRVLSAKLSVFHCNHGELFQSGSEFSHVPFGHQSK